MTIAIRYENMPVSESLDTILTKKLDKLSKKYSWLIRAEVLFKMEKHLGQFQPHCSITMSAPGPRLFADATDDDFEKVAKAALERIERQLKKRKQTFSKK